MKFQWKHYLGQTNHISSSHLDETSPFTDEDTETQSGYILPGYRANERQSQEWKPVLSALYPPVSQLGSEKGGGQPTLGPLFS